MVYLERFIFASAEDEYDFFFSQKQTCYDSYYPFQIFPPKRFREIAFEDVTILYGGNGSGKSTALNVIAGKIGASRDAIFNRSVFFENYLKLCKAIFSGERCKEMTILTSDGVFDSLLDIRSTNQRIDRERDETMEEYMRFKQIRKYPGMFSEEEREAYEQIRRNPLADPDAFKRARMANSSTQSRYVRRNAVDNIREYSNGESAFAYFVHRIRENGIYILDEPENSLSPARQLELVQFLQDSARFYNCQLIIATHSPFLLSMKGARIYDLDEDPVSVRRWTELENVRAYYKLIKDHEHEFQ